MLLQAVVQQLQVQPEQQQVLLGQLQLPELQLVVHSMVHLVEVQQGPQVQPVPVLDLEIRLDDARAKLRPGQAVRVELSVPDIAGGAK